MKIEISFLSTVFLMTLTSCGSLNLNPRGCRTDGVWGERNFDGRPATESAYSETYYVWARDHEVRLRDFLLKRKIECSDVKRMRIEMKSAFFVKRELTVFVQQ